MTIKTELLLLEREANISRRDTTVAMQKRGAVRKLFGSPDRNELQRQVELQEHENNKKLDGFKYDGVIGIVMKAPDHAKRLTIKRSSSVQSESEDDDVISSPLVRPTRSSSSSFQHSNLLTAEASASVVVAAPSSSSSSSASSIDAQKLPCNMNGSPRIVPRPRGQQTITSYPGFRVIKRGRTDRHDHRRK